MARIPPLLGKFRQWLRCEKCVRCVCFMCGTMAGRWMREIHLQGFSAFLQFLPPTDISSQTTKYESITASLLARATVKSFFPFLFSFPNPRQVHNKNTLTQKAQLLALCWLGCVVLLLLYPFDLKINNLSTNIAQRQKRLPSRGSTEKGKKKNFSTPKPRQSRKERVAQKDIWPCA